MQSTKSKVLNNRLLNQFFSGKSKAVGSGKFTVTSGKSQSGVCKFCQSQRGSHNNIAGTGKTPPYHPNCKCSIS